MGAPARPSALQSSSPSPLSRAEGLGPRAMLQISHPRPTYSWITCIRGAQMLKTSSKSASPTGEPALGRDGSHGPRLSGGLQEARPEGASPRLSSASPQAPLCLGPSDFPHLLPHVVAAHWSSPGQARLPAPRGCSPCVSEAGCSEETSGPSGPLLSACTAESHPALCLHRG